MSLLTHAQQTPSSAGPVAGAYEPEWDVDADTPQDNGGDNRWNPDDHDGFWG